MQSTISSPPKLSLLQMFRLGLFQLGLGIMSLLTLGLLNRIMINELAIPGTVAAGFVAVPLFMSPARVWFGQMSDARPLFGLHRTGYVWLGSLLFSLSAFACAIAIWPFGRSLYETGWSAATMGWCALLGGMFGLYGLALSASSTPFAALLVDTTDEEERSRLIGIVWSMLMVGIVIGAIVVAGLLPRSGACRAEDIVRTAIFATPEKLATLQASVNRIFVLLPATVFGLAIAATAGIERRFSRFSLRSEVGDREDKITLGRALRILTANRQTGIFFTFLLVMTMALFMQDATIEPYGGEVFGMCVADTTKLNAFFGTGTLIGISATGFAIVPRLGKETTARLGCYACVACFGLLIAAGVAAQPNLLKGSMFAFGLASGMTTTGAISLMLDLTAAATAGTFIGAWGLSQAIARGLATVFGGVTLDLGRSLFGIPVLAYGLVFAVQALGMLVAVRLLSRVDVEEFRTNARQALSAIAAGELD